MKYKIFNHEILLPTNKKFGFFFSIVFAIITFYLFTVNKFNLVLFFSLISIIFFVLGFINSILLTPFNKAWMFFGFLLSLIVGPIVLAIIFFGLFTPIAIIMRIFGRDELKLRITPVLTYWKKRNPNLEINQSFTNQF